MDIQCLSRSVIHRYSFFNGQSVSVMDSLCLSWTVCVCHGQSVSVTDILCLFSVINTFSDNFRAEGGWKIHDFGTNCP